MTLEQILTLLEAGYTREEINEMRDLQTQEPEPQPEPKQEDKTDPESKQEDKTDPEPKQEDKTDPEPKHYPDEISKLTEQVKALTESMQEHFRNTAEEKKTGVSDGDSILKSILEKGEI